jgi:hypothetical protein
MTSDLHLLNLPKKDSHTITRRKKKQHSITYHNKKQETTTYMYPIANKSKKREKGIGLFVLRPKVGGGH